MRIIEHGYNYSHIKFKCHSCGCLFEAEDFTEMKLHHGDELNPPYYTSTCPECGNECWSITTLYKNAK